MRKLRILYIITKNDVGGAQKYVHDLAANLDKNLFETKIIYGGQDIRWLSNKTYPWLLFINDWLAVLELVKIFKKERPDVIHLNSSKAGIIGSLAAWICKLLSSLNAKRYSLNAKVVFTAHGWVFNPTNDLSWFQRKFYIWIHRLAAKFQDKIICVSKYDYNLALCYSTAPKEKLVAIHNGIDLNIKFLDKAAAREQLMSYSASGADTVNESGNKNSRTHKLTNSPTDKLINSTWVGSIGRLVKEKNYETFIRAAALMRDPNNHNATPTTRTHPNNPNRKIGSGVPFGKAFGYADSSDRVSFFIIGDGYEKQRLQSLITHYSLQHNFFIIKPTGEDYKYLKAFDVFVLPSIKEGLPYTVLEAMAAAVPIVATNVGGLPEILKDNCGVIIAPRQPEKLAIAITRLLNDTKTTTNLIARATAKIRSEFDLSQMVKKTSNTYLLA